MEAYTISERKYKLKPQSESYFPVITSVLYVYRNIYATDTSLNVHEYVHCAGGKNEQRVTFEK